MQKLFYILILFQIINIVGVEAVSSNEDSSNIKLLLDKASDHTFECREEGKKALNELMKLESAEDIRCIVEELGTRNISRKNILLKVLTHIGGKAESHLEKVIGKRDEKTAFAILVLGRIGGDSSKRKVRRYLDDPDMSIRKAAAYTAGRFKDKAAVKRLITLLNDPGDPVRVVAARSLGEIGDDRAIHHLVKSLNDPIFTVRFTASEALLKFGMRAETELEKLLKQDLPDHIKLHAERTLKNISDGG